MTRLINTTLRHESEIRELLRHARGIGLSVDRGEFSGEDHRGLTYRLKGPSTEVVAWFDHNGSPRIGGA